MKMRINGAEMSDSSSCNCEMGDSAMVFVQVQEIGDVFNPDEAFACGTLFPELNKPFLAGGC